MWVSTGSSPLSHCSICTRLSSKTLSVTLLCPLPCSGADGRALSVGGDPGWVTAGLAEGAGGLPLHVRTPYPLAQPGPGVSPCWVHRDTHTHTVSPVPAPTDVSHGTPGQTCTRGRRGCRVPVHPGMMSPVAMAMLLHHCVAARPNPGISTGAAWCGQQDGAWVPRGLGAVWVLLGGPTGVAAAPARRELCACAKNGSGLLRGTGLVGTGSGQ